jgi:hypothetical protein
LLSAADAAAAAPRVQLARSSYEVDGVTVVINRAGDRPPVPGEGPAAAPSYAPLPEAPTAVYAPVFVGEAPAGAYGARAAMCVRVWQRAAR